MTSTQTVTGRDAPSQEVPRPEPPRPPFAVFVPLIGFLVLFALTTVFGATRAEVPSPVALAALAAALAGCAVAATPPVTVLLTICAFMDYDGFVAGRHGQLSWHGGQDAIRIAVLVAGAVVGAVVRLGRSKKARSR